MDGSKWSSCADATEDPCNKCAGYVGCNNHTGHIVSLDLDSLGLNGALPGKALAALPSLQSMSITLGAFDALHGTLPTELARLTALRYLSVTGSGCAISGTLPSEYGRMSLLGGLTLGGQDDDPWPLSGTLPPSLASLGAAAAKTSPPSLLLVQLGPNKISGTLSPAIGAGPWRGLQRSLQLSGSASYEGVLDWGSSISGTLPTEVGRLSALGDFELRNMRSLSGTMPTYLGNMASLADGFALTSSGLSGSFPTQLGRVTSLVEVEFRDLRISGTLPTQLAALTSLTSWVYDGGVDELLCPHCPALSGTLAHAFASMTALQSLELTDCFVSGTIPAAIGRLADLSDISLSGLSQLSGSMPPSMGLLTSLSGGFAGTGGLQLARLPRLSGSLPPALGNLSALSVLGLNQLDRVSGTLPPQLSRLTAMSDLSIDIAPRLSGSLPPSLLARLLELQDLALVATALSGTIPTQIGRHTLMDGLTLGWSETETNPTNRVPCRISGTIPTEVGLMTQLRLQLELAGPMARLSGTLPTELRNMTILQQVLIDAPRLSGTLAGGALGAMPQLTTLSMPGNRVSGTLPRELCSSADSQIGGVYLDRTRISGTLPAEWAQSTQLRSLSVSPPLEGDDEDDANVSNTRFGGTSSHDNNASSHAVRSQPLSGTIPSQWAALRMFTLALPNGSLHGNFSFPAFPGWSGLSRLDLSGNNFSGALLENCSTLRGGGFNGGLSTLKVGGNAFYGAIGESCIAHCPDLKDLLIEGQRHGPGFDGFVPASLGGLTKLQNIVAIGNSLSGTVPSNLSSLPALQVLALAGNRLSGSLPASIAAIPYLTSLLLAKNRMHGDVPPALASIASLASLDLSRNGFGGSLPPFAANHSLQALRLSLNHVSGTIPQALLSLPHLSLLEVDRNDLSCALPDTAVGGGPLLPAVSNTSRASLSVLAGNLIGCPLPDGVSARDTWGASYVCGLARMLGDGPPFGLARITTPAGMTVLALGLFAVCALLRKWREAATPLLGVAASDAPPSVKREAELFARFQRASVGACAMVSVASACLAVLYFRADSSMTCRYEKRLTAAFVSGGLPTLLIAALWLVLTLTVVVWSVAGRRGVGGEGKQSVVLTWVDGDDMAAGEVGAAAEGTCLVLLTASAGLLCGAVPNVLYVLIESRVLTFESSLVTQLVVMAIALAKSLVGSQLVPLLAVLTANWLLPMTLQARSMAKSGFATGVTFFNALCWPILAALTLNPSCFRDALVTPEPVPVHYNLTDCYIRCVTPGSAECPNAGHLDGCEVVISTPHVSSVQPEFEWNDQCASIAVSIYGPIYTLMFAYAILASAVWLLQTSALVEAIKANLLALKQRVMPPRPPPADPPPPPGLVARLLAKLKPAPKAPSPPVLGLVGRYAVTAQHLAIIASFGAVYPPVALLGTIKIALDGYVTPRQLGAAAQKDGARLVLEGIEGIAPASALAVLAFQTGLLFFVLGPYGLVQLPAATPLALVGAVGGGLGVLVGRRVTGWTRGRGGGGSMGDRLLLNAMLAHEDPATAAGADEYVRAFEAWRQKEPEAQAEREVGTAGGGE